MTLNQLQSLTDDELAMALYIVNNINPLTIPPGPLDPRDLTWFKHSFLIQRFIDAFSKLKPEGHATYKSLMEKLGMKVEINPIPENPIPEKILPEDSGSVNVNQ